MARHRRDATRDAIVDSALALFVERGYESVRVEDVARAAGVSRATFYNHFPEREGILGALLERLLATDGAEPGSDAGAVPPLEAVRAVATDAARRMQEQEALARFVYGLPVRHESLLRPHAASTPAVFRHIHRLLEQAVAAGDARADVPVDLLCVHVHNALEAGMRAWAEGSTDDPVERVAVLVDLALRGVAASATAGRGDDS